MLQSIIILRNFHKARDTFYISKNYVVLPEIQTVEMDISLMCVVCLSDTSSDLLPLGEFEKLYELLGGKTELTFDNKLYTCPTCNGYFSQIKEFQNKIESAQDVLLALVKLPQQNNTAIEQKTEPAFKNEFSDFSSDEDNTPLALWGDQESKIEPQNEKKSSNSVNDSPHNDIKVPQKKYRKKAKTKWSDSRIDAYIEKHSLPFDRAYVKELINFGNFKKLTYNIVSGETLIKTNFDQYVETKVCNDEDEIKKNMIQSREQQSYLKRKNRCYKCVLVFNCLVDLKKHINDLHPRRVGLPECKFCRTRIPEESMEEHVQTHYVQYVCKLCNHVACNKELMYEHFRAKRKMHQCPRCEKWLKDKEEFQVHFVMHHQRFECHHCSKEFYDKLDFEKHMLDWHIPQKCNICNKEYKNLKMLVQHKQYKHVTVAKSEELYCVECDKYFPNKHRFKHHGYRTHPNKPRPLVKERFPCDECGSSFSSTHYLKMHINYKHKNLRPQCHICAKFYASITHLRTHIERVHEKIRTPKTKVCHYCNRGFRTTRVLVHHIRTHTGERPHQCPLCNAAFAQKIALHSHVKTKHKDAGPNLVYKSTKKIEPAPLTE